MTLHQQIKQKTLSVPTEELLKKLGYQNLQLGEQTLNAFLDSKSIYQWLLEGYFYFKYNSESFLKKLSSILEIPSEEVEAEIKKDKEHVNTIKSMKQPYSFVNTNFKRTSEPIFALAFMENKRRVFFEKEELYNKSDEVILELVGQTIKQHYIDNNDELKLWGLIENYIYHHIDNRTFIFDTNGKIIKQPEQPIIESKAEFKIGNKAINIGGVLS